MQTKFIKLLKWFWLYLNMTVPDINDSNTRLTGMSMANRKKNLTDSFDTETGLRQNVSLKIPSWAVIVDLRNNGSIGQMIGEG